MKKTDGIGANVSPSVFLISVLLFAVVARPVEHGAERLTSSPDALRVLVITGGHSFEEKEFFDMFRAMKGVTWDHVSFGDGAEIKLTVQAARDYRALLFYDMHQQREPHWRAWLELLEKGNGMVFLHHTLWAYDEVWDEYPKILGGRASSKTRVRHGPSPTSTYKHDVIFPVQIADRSHAITRGLEDFEIHDETYNFYWVDPDVHVLLTTNHPDSERIIGWTRSYKNSRIVYIQPGHGPSAYGNPNYQKLVEQALHWAARRPQ